MAKVSMKALSKKMRNLDYCMMTTATAGGALSSRPMSNNGEVEYDGNSYFFTWKKSRLVKDLKKNSRVNLEFMGAKRLFVSVTGQAKLTDNRAKMADHWTKELKTWFKDGVDTDGLVMVQVAAKRIKFWQDEQEGEVVVR